jgi:hypothetical protein
MVSVCVFTKERLRWKVGANDRVEACPKLLPMNGMSLTAGTNPFNISGTG